jgi:Phospholipase_D-nuclease N-terminal
MSAFFSQLQYLNEYNRFPGGGGTIVGWFVPFLVSLFVVAMLHIGLMVYYIVHVIRNTAIRETERIIWILLFIFLSTLSFIIYFFMRIVPEETVAGT